MTPHVAEVVTDDDRYPTLTAAGRQMVQFLREHPHAPIFRNESGNRLTAQDVERVLAFERETRGQPVGWRHGEHPHWLDAYVAGRLADVPFYRRYGAATARLEELPTTSRADLSRDVTQFVPDSVPLDRLINFRTSGTTGHPLLIASHPVVAASYLAFHKRALRRFGIELTHGRGQVGVVLVGHQRHCFTYVSVTPTMDESGFAKINLHPADWRDPGDRVRYLDALQPEVYTGDPISFDVLAGLPLRTRPRVLISTSMALSPGLRDRLQARFECPVVDVYSMNEAGPIAVRDPAAGGHVLLQPGMFVEILDPAGRPVPPGERGEVTLTGGFNAWLPLLRYGTGDYAALRLDGSVPVLGDLEGRPPVRYRTAEGGWINNIEITHALRVFAIPQYTVCQRGDGSIEVRLSGASGARERVREVLVALVGAGQRLSVEEVAAFDGKVVQYTSELGDACP